LWATRTAERDEGLGGVLEALPLRLHDAEASLLVGALAASSSSRSLLRRPPRLGVELEIAITEMFSLTLFSFERRDARLLALRARTGAKKRNAQRRTA